MDIIHCYIAGAGEFAAHALPRQGDFVIAADAGYAALTSRGIAPNLVVGDFDSLGCVPDHPNVARANAEKDDTDMMLAVKEGLARGLKNFTINGGLGGRIDQTYANIQILAFLAENGARGTLVGNDACITAIKDGKIELAPRPHGEIISVFCHGDAAQGVTLKGLKYPLTDATLTSSYPLGVSNEFTDESAVVEVKKGTLIITYPS